MADLQLRVGVPPSLASLPAVTGRGRMWCEILERLGQRTRLVVAEPPLRSWRAARAPHVWVGDGHEGPLPVRAPQVLHLHEASWTDPETRATLTPEFLARVEEPSRRAAGAAALLMTISAHSQREITTAYDLPLERVVVAHHGVDHDVFRPGRAGGADLVARHGGRPDVPYVLCVASVHPRKNLPALREAMALVAEAGFPHQLVLVGAPAWGRPDSDELARAATAELPGHPGRVTGIPFGLPDEALAALMAGAAAFCLPSLGEGFGLPVAEAMACATPTVVSNRAALPEVAGEAALVVEPSPTAIAGALTGLFADGAHADAVGAACHRRAAAFTWDAAADRWLEALQRAARAGHQGAAAARGGRSLVHGRRTARGWDGGTNTTEMSTP